VWSVWVNSEASPYPYERKVAMMLNATVNNNGERVRGIRTPRILNLGARWS